MDEAETYCRELLAQWQEALDRQALDDAKDELANE
jgi:hypothetical protein